MQNNSLENTLKIAKNRCSGNYEKTGIPYPFFLLYPFTTENISGYIDSFELKDKTLLTVGSSLDQALNAILKDSKSITVMDINPYTKYYYYLKKASILELDYNEFEKFLRLVSYPSVFKDNKYALNIESFNKIKPLLKELDYESYYFWNELINKYGSLRVRESIFNMDEDQTKVLRKLNIYLNNEFNYKILKQKIDKANVSFITEDIFNINITEKFDNIWLSNICCYINDLNKIKELLIKYSKLLNKNGELLLSYLYETPSNQDYQDNWPIIYDFNNLYKILQDYNLSLEEFIGVKGILFNDKKIKDSVLIYKKK